MNNETKERFFALYWGQTVLSNKWNENRLHKVNHVEMGLYHEDYHLLLTPLSAITEDHAMDLGHFQCNDKGHPHYGLSAAEVLLRNFIDYGWDMFSANEIDALRGAGYATPFMKMSPEMLVKKGWIKLKEATHE